MMRASQGGVFSSLSYSRKRCGYEARLDMNVNGEKTRRETAGLSHCIKLYGPIQAHPFV